MRFKRGDKIMADTIEIIENINKVVISTGGIQGIPGQGVPAGGMTGQILAKKSTTNYDTEWIESSIYLVKLSDTVLSGHRAVSLDSNDKAVYADKDTSINVVGITLNSGTEVTIQQSGEITEPSWNWIPSQSIYLGSNGMLTQTAPTSGYLIELGKSITNIKMILNIKTPILLA